MYPHEEMNQDGRPEFQSPVSNLGGEDSESQCAAVLRMEAVAEARQGRREASRAAESSCSSAFLTLGCITLLEL